MKNDLQNIIRRIEKIEAIVFASSTSSKKVGAGGSSSSLPSKILALRDAGFFKEPKAAAEVHAKLQPGYACEMNRVEVALRRIFNKKSLRKTTKSIGGKKVIAYTW